MDVANVKKKRKIGQKYPLTIESDWVDCFGFKGALPLSTEGVSDVMIRTARKNGTRKYNEI
eukprot:CAMPEP_0176463644 /NCGR_PEP_ID=MMETSP0127-20121128/36014_1 /TAXON_ID=938130 /ORGANISM="Platyophrya macrostoma, Strain WH" /LENGTH=60 /DNA_ID=CAMNT_0017855849 /DNA_START=199 /DNA_END=381 /DNA_ORIENTATION=-